MTISPWDLQYFLETANTLNLSRAAERLGISQPSLSQAILRIESALGESVFVRHKRGVTMTPAGQQLVVHGLALLQAWNNVKSKATASMREVQGRYTIGCHVSVAMYSLSAFLPKLLQDHPALEIRLLHDMSRHITEKVISSQIEIGIVVNPKRHPDLIIHKVADDDVTFWVNAEILEKKKSVENLVAMPLIYDHAMLQAHSLLRRSKKWSGLFQRSIESGSLEVIADLVASGCGVGILPSRVAQQARSRLARLPHAPVFLDEVCVVTRVENKQVAAIQHIVKAIKEGCR